MPPVRMDHPNGGTAFSAKDTPCVGLLPVSSRRSIPSVKACMGILGGGYPVWESRSEYHLSDFFLSEYTLLEYPCLARGAFALTKIKNSV